MSNILQTFESLKKLIQEFDMYCPPNMLVNVTVGNSSPSMVLYNVYYSEPCFLVFDFVTYEKTPCRIILNSNQLSISLSYVPTPEKSEIKKPIGFEPPSYNE